MYVAVIECAAGPSLLVVSVATPPDTRVVPTDVDPSKNSTLPGPEPATVAVSVTGLNASPLLDAHASDTIECAAVVIAPTIGMSLPSALSRGPSALAPVRVHV